ncbi:uncharacterized protein LOC133337524 [Musca vetustissima]|uniref:uncharacterized protein LOC133337524 n=1 Tax=Musca vetustissima TaxID=27455 RepID=UPI002AB7B2DB|nr:uncharacterized protein LOC133337524 [Musca vetustissima]
MDECENLVIDLEVYEELDLKHQQQQNQNLINDNDIEVLELTANFDTEETMGQTESKRHSKKHNAGEIQTKGTAMSFGFRKNLNTTPKKLKKLLKGENAKKKQDKCNNVCTNDTEANATDEHGDSATP